MTLYETIGARSGDDATTLRRAYLAQVRRSHPDVGPPTERAMREAKMRELNAAWAVLSDEDRRANYDDTLTSSGGGSFSAGRSGAATPPRPQRPFRPLHPDDDDTGWREESDAGVPGTAIHPLLQFVPVGFGLAAVLTLLTSFVTHQDRLVGLAVVFGFLAGVAFLLVPLLAMLAGARAENSGSPLRHPAAHQNDRTIHVATYLDDILAAHRRAADDDTRSLSRLIEQATAMAPTVSAADALTAGDRLAVIAEVKRASPSKGELHANLDPKRLAATYGEAGAAMVSVLTDEAFFRGSAADLAAARSGFAGPILRKDFTVSPADVCDARLMGADVVLLIAAALDDAELADFAALATEVGLSALVEAHDETEVERAVEVAGASLVGVNQRDLVTFQVDTARAVRVAATIPDGVVAIAESGVTGPADARRLADAGYHAVLVGEHLVTSAHPAAALSALAVQRRAP